MTPVSFKDYFEERFKGLDARIASLTSSVDGLVRSVDALQSIQDQEFFVKSRRRYIVRIAVAVSTVVSTAGFFILAVVDHL